MTEIQRLLISLEDQVEHHQELSARNRRDLVEDIKRITRHGDWFTQDGVRNGCQRLEILAGQTSLRQDWNNDESQAAEELLQKMINDIRREALSCYLPRGAQAKRSA